MKKISLLFSFICYGCFLGSIAGLACLFKMFGLHQFQVLPWATGLIFFSINVLDFLTTCIFLKRKIKELNPLFLPFLRLKRGFWWGLIAKLAILALFLWFVWNGFSFADQLSLMITFFLSSVIWNSYVLWRKNRERDSVSQTFKTKTA